MYHKTDHCEQSCSCAIMYVKSCEKKYQALQCETRGEPGDEARSPLLLPLPLPQPLPGCFQFRPGYFCKAIARLRCTYFSNSCNVLQLVATASKLQCGVIVIGIPQREGGGRAWGWAVEHQELNIMDASLFLPGW